MRTLCKWIFSSMPLTRHCRLSSESGGPVVPIECFLLFFHCRRFRLGCNLERFQNLNEICLWKKHGEKTGWLSSAWGCARALSMAWVKKENSLKLVVLSPEDWARAADVKYMPSPATWTVPRSKSRAGALQPPLKPWQVVQGRLVLKPLFFTLQSRAVARGPAGCVPGWLGDSGLLSPELPLPVEGIAHQLSGPNRKRAKVWMQLWSS